jgi:holo-[acyl-carrier protein] synthase
VRIIGHGIDVTSIARVRRELDEPHEQWTHRFYSARERANADAPPAHYRYYAGRFAAKEAVVKALGTGFAGDITWRGIDVLRTESGAPHVELADEVLAFAKSLGVTRWFISISYSGDIAMASAIAVGD